MKKFACTEKLVLNLVEGNRSDIMSEIYSIGEILKN